MGHISVYKVCYNVQNAILCIQNLKYSVHLCANPLHTAHVILWCKMNNKYIMALKKIQMFRKQIKINSAGVNVQILCTLHP
jgi:hypothetical protein